MLTKAGLTYTISYEGENTNPSATGHFDCYGDTHVITCSDCGQVVGRTWWNGPNYGLQANAPERNLYTGETYEEPDQDARVYLSSDAYVSRAEVDRDIAARHDELHESFAIAIRSASEAGE